MPVQSRLASEKSAIEYTRWQSCEKRDDAPIPVTALEASKLDPRRDNMRGARYNGSIIIDDDCSAVTRGIWTAAWRGDRQIYVFSQVCVSKVQVHDPHGDASHVATPCHWHFPPPISISQTRNVNVIASDSRRINVSRLGGMILYSINDLQTKATLNGMIKWHFSRIFSLRRKTHLRPFLSLGKIIIFF